MPRRSNTRASNTQSALQTSPPPALKDPDSDNLALLRRQWQWAAFSQFFCTFSPLFALSDVTVADIERDLVHQTNHVVSRIMQKLLYTLSYDRKVSVDNWQIALRKQYMKRNPEANPLGSEQKDTRHVGKDEDGEVTESLKVEMADPSQEIVDEANTERVNSVARTSSVSVDVIDGDFQSQESDKLSRQSSTIPNVVVSDSKNIMIDETEVEEKVLDWFDLPILSKLESIYTLSEWQFQNPVRLRTVMKSDDEVASWRIEPIGYDSKRNAYWFIGGDRLWIQRVPPKVIKIKPLKRKRAPEKVTESLSAMSTSGTPMKRARIAAEAADVSTPTSGRHSRAAKEQAKLKLDVQARELEELNRQASLSSRSTRPTRQASSRAVQSNIISASKPVGTRASARLRGPQQDEWQPIPDEWLDDSRRGKAQATKSALPKTGLESDEETVSDLTELSEEVNELKASTQTTRSKKQNGTAKTSGKFDAEEPENVTAVASNFVEWETICVTLQEWEHIAERFEKATHYSEKALYKTLVNEIVPIITNELKDIQRKRELEEALQHRKRSSRLAIRESEKEEARLAAQRKQEEDEKLSRTRRMEARQQKEESERLKREAAREQRRKEREAREESRKNITAAQEAAKSQIVSKSQSKTPIPENPSSIVNGKGKNGSHSGSRTPAGEDWELDCEICQRRGVNLDDGTPMMSCGRCSKWQHILCHDRADQAAGRSRRNWDSVEFFCRSCRMAEQDRYRDYQHPASQHPSYQNAPQMQPYRSYATTTQSPVDIRASQYVPYRDSTQQSYYVRPPHTQQYNSQGAHQSTSSSHNIPPAARQTISFSHYQPAAHGFVPGPQKIHPESHYQYHNAQQQPYNYSHQQYTQPNYNSPSQQYRPAQSTYYKSQASTPAWDAAIPANAPGYHAGHNGTGPMPSPSAYRNPALEHQDVIRPSEPSPSSYARYPPTDQPYSSTQYKHHSASYQPPVGR